MNNRITRLAAIGTFLVPAVGSAFSKPRKLPGNDITFHLAASMFPSADTARSFAAAAARIWQTYGGADVYIDISASEPIDPLFDPENGENVIIYDPAAEECAGNNGFAGWDSPYSGQCDIVICNWSTDRSEQNYTLKVLAHELGHCLGFNHAPVGSAALMADDGSYVKWTFLSSDDVAGLYASPAYPKKSTELQTAYSSSAGTNWTTLSSAAGGIANASFRKPDVVPRDSSNRYAIAYSDAGDNLRVIVSDGNNTIDSNVDTGGNTYSGPGVAWKSDGSVMIVAYRAFDSGLYVRRSTNLGVTWSGFTQLTPFVASTVDADWSASDGRFYVAAESTLGGTWIFSSSDGLSWTHRQFLDIWPITSGGFSLSCAGLSPGGCLLGANLQGNLNTHFYWFEAYNATTVRINVHDTVTDGYWSAGEVEVAEKSGASSLGVYSFRSENSVNSFSRWTGTYDFFDGTLRSAGIGNWGPASVTHGPYFNEFFRVTPQP